jgi:hypothetical protein
MSKTKDELIKELLGVVDSKKMEIAKAEKPSWETNCSFSPTGNASDRKNIQVETDVDFFVDSLAGLMMKREFHAKAQQTLGVKTEFKHQSFTFEQWEADFKTRLSKIKISEKKKELADLEARLNKLVSKEERERLELESLSNQVKNL